MPKGYRNVLIVDDNSDIRALLRLAIESKFDRVKITEASDGQEGLQAIEKFHQDRKFFNCIISDINMPHMDGREFRLEVEKRGLDTPFIFCTSEDVRSISQDPVFQAANGVVSKDKLNQLFPLVNEIFNDGEIEPGLEDTFVGVPLRFFLMIRHLPCDVYLALGPQKFVRVFKAKSKLEKQDITKYQSRKLREFLVPRRDFEALVLSVGKIITAVDLVGQVNTRKLVEESMMTYQAIHGLTEAFGWDENLREMVAQTTDTILRAMANEFSLVEVLAPYTTQDVTYLAQHSIVLSFISCAMAKKLEWGSDVNMSALVLAAFLHDLTLTEDQAAHMDLHIRNAMRVDLHELQEVMTFRNHPLRSGRLVEDMPAAIPRAGLLPSQKVIEQHHELPDGTGFPKGIHHEEITPLSALFIIAEDLTDFFKGKEFSRAELSKWTHQSRSKFHSGKFGEIMDWLTATPEFRPFE